VCTLPAFVSAAHPLCGLTANNDSSSFSVVNTNNGLVRGCNLEGGGSAYTIPFAEPPLGDLRFRAPRPIVAPWEGVLDGKEDETPNLFSSTSL